MSRYEATFEIGSKTDAHAVRLLIERVHDTLREELRGLDRKDASLDETLHELQAIREATRRPSSGTLTITYERDEGTFDE